MASSSQNKPAPAPVFSNGCIQNELGCRDLSGFETRRPGSSLTFGNLTGLRITDFEYTHSILIRTPLSQPDTDSTSQSFRAERSRSMSCSSSSPATATSMVTQSLGTQSLGTQSLGTQSLGTHSLGAVVVGHSRRCSEYSASLASLKPPTASPGQAVRRR